MSLIDPSKELVVRNELMQLFESGSPVQYIQTRARTIGKTWTVAHIACMAMSTILVVGGLMSMNTNENWVISVIGGMMIFLLAIQIQKLRTMLAVYFSLSLSYTVVDTYTLMEMCRGKTDEEAADIIKKNEQLRATVLGRINSEVRNA